MIKKIIGIVTIWGFSIHIAVAQNVESVVFERAVDYINCQITKVSLADQTGKGHLEAFNKAVGNHNCEFEPLVVFLKTRETGVMTKNLELSFFINSYKEKYKSTLTNGELYALLKNDLLEQAPIQNFKIKHENSFPAFENNVGEYLNRLFKMNETVSETIEDGMGDVVMVIEEDEEQANSTVTDDNALPETIEERETPSISEPSVERILPFGLDEGEEIYTWSSWLFRFSLLFTSLAILLYVLLPYYEKREKARVKKPGGDVHPLALSLEVEIAIMQNNNRLLKRKIKKIHLDLDEYEDTFKTVF